MLLLIDVVYNHDYTYLFLQPVNNNCDIRVLFSVRKASERTGLFDSITIISKKSEGRILTTGYYGVNRRENGNL
jgi:hypothetical protein